MSEPLEELVQRWRELESQAVLAGTQNAYETCANELTAALTVRHQEARVMELAKRDAAEAHYGYGRWERDEWLLVSIPHKQPFDFCTQGRCAAIREAEARKLTDAEFAGRTAELTTGHTLTPSSDAVGLDTASGNQSEAEARVQPECTCGNNFANPEPYCAKHYLEARARQPVAAWQPIETAPKDGTEIVLTDGSRRWLGVWVEHPATALLPNGIYQFSRWQGSKEPTHWSPAPPLAAAQPIKAPEETP